MTHIHPERKQWQPAAVNFRRSKPVAALGRVAQVGVAAVMVLAIADLFPLWHEMALMNALLDHRQVSLTEAQHSDDVRHTFAVLTLVVFAVAAIAWITWFFRLRRNVERWDSAFQRLGTGWGIGAWICPIVSYWFPYQIARDVYDDTERDLNGWYRPTRHLLGWWWAAYVAMLLFGVVSVRWPDKTAGQLRTGDYFEALGTVATLVAGVLAIMVINKLTLAQTARTAREEARLLQITTSGT